MLLITNLFIRHKSETTQNIHCKWSVLIIFLLTVTKYPRNQEGKCLFWLSFRGFSNSHLSLLLLGPNVVRQNIMVGSMCWTKVAHLMVELRQRAGGRRSLETRYTLQRHALSGLFQLVFLLVTYLVMKLLMG
jgi:hypothetical protein